MAVLVIGEAKRLLAEYAAMTDEEKSVNGDVLMRAINVTLELAKRTIDEYNGVAPQPPARPKLRGIKGGKA